MRGHWRSFVLPYKEAIRSLSRGQEVWTGFNVLTGYLDPYVAKLGLMVLVCAPHPPATTFSNSRSTLVIDPLVQPVHSLV